MNIFDYWDKKLTPRKVQRDALEWLSKQSAKYLFLEAPVGSGKSQIGMTYSKFISGAEGDSFILTPQRILQEQYCKSFPNATLAPLYGKSNYPCANKNTTCDIGSLVKSFCTTCPHKLALEQAKQAPNVVLNYTLGFLHFTHLDIFKRRELMILDECHFVEKALVDFDSICISRFQAQESGLIWPELADILTIRKWVVNEYIPIIEAKIAELSEAIRPLFNKPNLTPTDVASLREHERIDTLINELAPLSVLPDKTLIDEYVLVYDKMSIKFKQITARKSFMKTLNPLANRFLFMSSTILNPKGFCRDLGIDPEDAAFISLSSEFPVENRPVYYMPQTKMNAGWISDSRKPDRDKMVSYIDDLLDMHSSDSGIIHTGNFAVAEWLVSNIKSTHHNVFHHNPQSGDDRNSVISAYTKSKKPAVLISPSITEGLDLKDDLGRFAIFAKIPFGFLGDQWIKKRLDLSSEWYQRQALIHMIQGSGRVVRSQNDWGNVYILDASFGYLYDRTKHLIPEWWNSAYLTAG